MGRDGGPGRIILIDGASSAGKSTLALSLQGRLASPFWHWSIDHLRVAGVLPAARIASGEFGWPAMRAQFFEGFHRSIPALAAGNDLIVEHIVETEAWSARLVMLLVPFDVFLIRLHCPLAELERREAERCDRRRGEARSDVEHACGFRRYDLELDSTRPVDRNASEAVTAWNSRRAPSALAKMVERTELERPASNDE